MSPDPASSRFEPAAPGLASASASIRDDRPGIDLDHRPNICDRFHQAHAGEYRSDMGIRLFISRRIADLHYGTLEPTALGDGGSPFTLTVPLATHRNEGP